MSALPCKADIGVQFGMSVKCQKAASRVFVITLSARATRLVGTLAQFGKQRWPSGPRWNPGGQARSYPLFGQQRFPSGPRCHPTGHARLVAKGWQKPLGPRHHPGPQSSAALAVPAMLVALVTATANAALKSKVLSMLISSNLIL